MYNRNAAFDFEAFEQRKVKKAKIFRLPDKEARQRQRVRAKRQLTLSLFSAFFIGAIGISSFVMGQVKLTEVSDQSIKASKELEQCKSVNTQLSVKLKAEAAKNVAQSTKDSPVEIVKVHKGDIAKCN